VRRILVLKHILHADSCMLTVACCIGVWWFGTGGFPAVARSRESANYKYDYQMYACQMYVYQMYVYQLYV